MGTTRKDLRKVHGFKAVSIFNRHSFANDVATEINLEIRHRYEALSFF